MNNTSLLLRIQEKKKKLDALRPLPKPIIKNITETLSLEWIYNSNAIEGNTLTLQETKLVLEEGITIKGKSLREHFEAKNHEHAIQYLETLVHDKISFSEKEILSIHSLVLQNIEKDFAGRYRNGQVRIIGANFVPPNFLKISEMMKKLLHNLCKNIKELDIITAASLFHHRFVWIHPFFDGNGRTARLMTNLILMKEGYPPAIILKNDRKKYYDALNKANNGNFQKLILLMAQSIERSLDIYLESMNTNEKEEYLPLRILAKNSLYSAEYLGLLARKGRIDAYKQGRNWVSTEDALEKYQKEKGG